VRSKYLIFIGYVWGYEIWWEGKLRIDSQVDFKS